MVLLVVLLLEGLCTGRALDWSCDLDTGFSATLLPCVCVEGGVDTVGMYSVCVQECKRNLYKCRASQVICTSCKCTGMCAYKYS